jgi:hypothetical protein
MELIRVDSNPNPKPDEHPTERRQTEHDIDNIDDHFPEASTVKMVFGRFGHGEQRRGDFVVEMTWIDIQNFVRAFIEMGHPARRVIGGERRITLR